MKSPKKFSVVGHANNDRSLPFFDNHYGNGVLIENWQEGRIYDACGRKFTLAMDNSVGPKRSTYTSDYTNPERTLLQPMMRRRGLGKALMFGEGNSTVVKSEPTSTTYGETQRHLIDSRYGTSHRAKDRLNNTMGGLSRQNFKGTTMPKTLKPTADEEIYGNFSSTKAAMDLLIECFHFQRQMAYNEMSR
ncbi:hypothetical protein C3747_19g300 [Trypanosoma cruzi]|uniref:Uncharacterized protein n=3 Tax=Trypanosoma cruzi TaxID=5693 RepID=Q4CMT3_TRYCC|nr:hypothetical protein, conserved [Trypanosoma cruzi]EAN81584.1 hypothetical protein, conserved [Trypanosoma cruzi]KAF8291161.1 hypothetical protein TcYC6_0124220 [Trypanosoma cruzi]PWV17289.1 hypothetical protein C3747_19g300 [Trypanosoma cruzi]RNC52918.1 hypothetical protein TcCL_ESM09796 [Trypanosoma cruzi]|eukprot:XP_803030.1 hypothetical protein [Trypanosoma cruzi strain CL Brener]